MQTKIEKQANSWLEKISPLLIIFSCLLSSSYSSFADANEDTARLKSIIALQQSQLDTQAMKISEMQNNLQSLSSKLSSILTTDGRLQATNGAVIVNQNGKWVGDVAGFKGDRGDKGDKGDAGSNGDTHLFVTQTGGGKSCQTQCNNESSNCIVALAGAFPHKTWTCDQKPAGNLACVCFH